MSKEEQIIRALALEEAARIAALGVVFEGPTRSVIVACEAVAKEIRALAPLPPGLVAIERETLGKVLAVVHRHTERCVAQRMGNGASFEDLGKGEEAVALLRAALDAAGVKP